MIKDQQLIEYVIAQIKDDLAMGDDSALSELLDFAPRSALIGYLSCDRQDDALQLGIISSEEAY